MADYKESPITGGMWPRCRNIIINNTLGETPSVVFTEEVAVQTAEGSTITSSPTNSYRIAFDPSAEFPLIDPATGEQIGRTVTHEDVYNILFSLYAAVAEASEAGTTGGA